jgi:ribose 5-phosphate isomerase B
MIIAIGNDHAALGLKAVVLNELGARGLKTLDLGANGAESVDYPDFARAVGGSVARGESALGVLLCGTGVGMSIAANKIKGVRAVVCSDVFSAKMAREHNDANVLCLGERVVGAGLAVEILNAFLSAVFLGGRHTVRVEKITALEK